ILTGYFVLILRGLASGGSVGGTLGRAIADLWQLAGMLGGHLMSALFGMGSSLSVQPLDFYQQLAFLSLTFGLINLLPLHPFDGGRIFVIVLRQIWKTQP
ncbi:MAG: site-2 protease family protein, partial [Thermosynechococcaceae cyanobacterium]